MATLQAGNSSTFTVSQGGVLSVSSNFGFGLVAIGGNFPFQFGPMPYRQVFGPFDSDVSVTLTSYTANVIYTTTNQGSGGGGGSVVVYNLPKASGGDDTAAINAILALNPSTPTYVKGYPGESYSCSSPLVIYSNTTLDMEGCLVTTPGSVSQIKNKASLPVRTVTDGAITAGSTSLTSATAAFTAADTGKAVGVVGAGPNYGLSTAPGTLYATMTYVNATTVTLSAAATSTVSNATVNVFGARDSNIKVIGGQWQNGNKDAVAQTINHQMYFRRVDGLEVSKAYLMNQRSTNGGGYGVSLADVTQAVVSTMRFLTGSDGIHVAGPASFINVRDIVGTCGDDMVAFTAVDFQTVAGSLGGDCEGDITDCWVENIHGVNSWSPGGITSGKGSNNVQRVAQRIFYNNISGSFVNRGLSLSDYGGAGSSDVISFSNVSLWNTSNVSSINLKMTGAGRVRIKDVTWPGKSSTGPNNGIVQVLNPVNTLMIDGMVQIGNQSGVGVNLLANIGQQLIVNNVSAPDNTTSFSVLYGNVASFSIPLVQLTNINKLAASGNIFQLTSTAAGFNLPEIQYTNVNISGGGSLFAAAADSGNTVRLRATNVRGQTGAIAIAYSPMTIYLDNVEWVLTGAGIRASSNAATPIRILGSQTCNISFSGGSLISRTATQAISVNGIGLQTDQTILTPLDGDIFWNTNATPLNGVGNCIYNSAAAKFKNLYSGTTS